MNRHTQKQILGEYALLGFSIQEVDDDCLEVYLKDSRIAALPLTASKRLVQRVCFDVVWGIRFLFDGAEMQPLPPFPSLTSFLKMGGASAMAGPAKPNEMLKGEY